MSSLAQHLTHPADGRGLAARSAFINAASPRRMPPVGGMAIKGDREDTQKNPRAFLRRRGFSGLNNPEEAVLSS